MTSGEPSFGQRIFGARARSVTRRAFLRRSGLLGLGAASGLLWACAPAAPAAKPTDPPKPTTAPVAASPAASPATAASPVAAGSPAASASPAASPASSPAASPAASPGASPSAKPAGQAPMQPAAPAANATGTITIAQGADITSLDPQQTQGSAPRAMIAAMFDQLVALDWDYKIVPWVATSWETPDDRTWVFNLRNDVMFHSGEPLTSAAVKWSIERFVAPETKNIYASTLQSISSIELPNDYTVRLTTKDPYPGLIDAMASYLYLSPPETMKSMGDEYFKKPVGSGPFKFVEWVPGDRLAQEAAAPHFSGDPKIKQVIWKTITEGPARVTAVRTGAADVINPVSPQEVAQIQQGGAQVVQAKG